MPPVTPHTEIINDLLKLAVDSGVSDVIIKSNKPGYVRLSGKLKPVDMDPITCPEAQAWVDEHVPRVFKANWDDLGQVDFAYAAEGIGRFRVNAFHQRGLVSIVMRHIKSTVPNFDQLGLGATADALIKLVQAKDGILLVCGATGSGKSSTMAAMLNWVNQNQDKHIVTIEDPIEYTFPDEKSLFQQREIGLDVPSFELAIKAVLRQNPDIILIGEMRDRETFETAISAAETGHLVFSTMHALRVFPARGADSGPPRHLRLPARFRLPKTHSQNRWCRPPAGERNPHGRRHGQEPHSRRPIRENPRATRQQQ
jgi:twitching motility protein PilT